MPTSAGCLHGCESTAVVYSTVSSAGCVQADGFSRVVMTKVLQCVMCNAATPNGTLGCTKTVWAVAMQNKGQECAALQQECRDLQDQLQSAEADYAKVRHRPT